MCDGAQFRVLEGPATPRQPQRTRRRCRRRRRPRAVRARGRHVRRRHRRTRPPLCSHSPEQQQQRQWKEPPDKDKEIMNSHRRKSCGEDRAEDDAMAQLH
mmetsp:Transcript_16146/g.48826  ORF Transcript_16146/g.48826 Transcript_16146/m.48826 type:complete len:100 (-) Transcript_16146:537-836(-)